MKVSIGHNIHFRLVFAGPFGVGKSTAIQNISDIKVVNTDVTSSEATAEFIQAGKTTTTVGFDYGEIHLDDATRVAVYGLPGQERFEQVWQNILSSNAGVVLWLFGDADNLLEECDTWLQMLHQLDATRFLTVVITRIPVTTPASELQPIRERVARYNRYAPVMVADPRNKNQVIQSVLMAIGNPELAPLM